MMNLSYAMPNEDTIQRTVLDNGIILLVYENPHTQSVVLTGSVRVGLANETPDKNGLASLVSSTLMRGTQTRDFDAIANILENIGADLSISSSTHSTRINGKALAEDLPVLLDVLNDSLRNPIFPENEVKRAIGERLTYLQYQNQDTRYMADRAFRENLYPATHPSHYGTMGTPETLQSIAIEDLVNFHHQNFSPEGMILTVVGAVDAAEVKTAVQKTLGSWNPDHKPAPVNVEDVTPRTESKRVFTAIPGKSQSDIVLGCLGPSRFAEDYKAAELANSVLGGFGMMGRVGEQIREKAGLAYYAYSRLSGGPDQGSWKVSAGVAPENVDQAIEKAIEEIRKIASEPVSEDDLSDNQSYFAGRLPLRLASNSGLASNIHSMERYDLGLDYLANYKERIYELTGDDLLAATQKYLKPDALIISVAGPDNH